ncbi:MAG: hypothetical protein CHACPFDD_00808 [Phycisphaerae bacterium]|nr:hypothetical protein [Phycisphaerae bacterium]
MNFKLARIKLALFGISAGMIALQLGQCIGDLIGDAIVLRGVD